MKEQTQPDDFKNMLDLLAVYTEAQNRLSTMETDASEHLLDFVDDVRGEYSQAQRALTESEAAIISIAGKHPEWFGDKRTIKTPYGQVSCRRTAKLEVPNEEATIILIQNSDLSDDEYLRQNVALNLEALERLEDAELKRLRIRRVTDESISVKAGKVDLGKAVKESPAEKQAA
jgi:hypothetical protein